MHSPTLAERGTFVRRASLAPHESRVNFRQIDNDVLAAVTSDEASAVTPLMSKIYLRLIQAPTALWERPGVLRFAGDLREVGPVGAWEQLVALLGVAPATARKALVWMHGCGVIGYFAGRNGVGIRVFINRAARSIRASAPAEKNLPCPSSSNGASPTSPGEAPFKESGSEEILEYEDPRAPSRARAEGRSTCQERDVSASPDDRPADPGRVPAVWKQELGALITRLCDRELARTREWFERAGMPKAARVAQRETYDLLRAHGVIRDRRSDGGRIGESVTADVSPPLFTREESVRLYAAYATEVLGVSLSNYLNGYVARGEMTSGEAQEMLVEACELGLGVEPLNAGAAARPSHT